MTYWWENFKGDLQAEIERRAQVAYPDLSIGDALKFYFADKREEYLAYRNASLTTGPTNVSKR